MRGSLLPGSIFLLLIFAIESFACSCMFGGDQPCASYWSTPAVFSGRVVEIRSVPANDDTTRITYQQKLVKFAVFDAFRGVSGQTVEVVTGMGGGDCGYDFKVNENYLVYAWSDKDKLSTGICSRTKLLSAAAGDLEFIHGLVGAKPVGFISGSVIQFRPRRTDEPWEANPPMAGLLVSVASKDGKFDSTTDKDGNFRFTDLAPGDYTLRAFAPAGFFPLVFEQKLKVPAKGCSLTGLAFSRDTAFTGRVLDENGLPAAKFPVNLVPVEYINAAYQKDQYFSQTDADGRFTFRDIPPGKYYLGVRLSRIGEPDFAYPRAFYPGTQNIERAVVLTNVEGQILDDLNFQLPARLQNRTIEGTVVFPDGKPVQNANVSSEEIEYASGSMGYSDAVTGTDGRFSMKRLDGLKYRVSVHVNMPDGSQRHAEPVEIPSNGNVNGIKFVITEPGGSCAKCRR